MIKAVLRFIFSVVFIILFWPFLLRKRCGNTKIKLTGNTVIIANHYSNFDPFLMAFLFFGKKIRFVATKDVKKRPIPRFISWIYDCFYFDNDSTSLTTYKDIIAFLSGGGIVAIFPEGLINPRKYGFLDFQNGASFIAKKAKADVVPIFLYPEFALFKKSRFYIGDTIPYSEYSVYKDNTSISTYFLSKIMDLSCLCN